MDNDDVMLQARLKVYKNSLYLRLRAVVDAFDRNHHTHSLDQKVALQHAQRLIRTIETGVVE